MAYRDAGYGPATYYITVLDTLKGLYKALTIGLIDVDNFDVDEYEFYERVENGDMNWISRKFLALANPKEEAPPQVLRAMSMNRYTTNGTLSKFYSVFRISELTQRFQEKGIKTIVRLNNKTYDRGKFLAAGIEHIEMYFPDGTTPPDAILLKFLELCENRAGKFTESFNYVSKLSDKNRTDCCPLQGWSRANWDSHRLLPDEALQDDGL